ncbi:FecR domain-containing protein [Erythrobacter sp. SG61-1L]|uniref:FecR family protein n=1 Tax=Erythrobacter sp. SG61-1L TaxID=1603897 RepID=UPI0006C9025B|nr:FecR domain-containing protein [Erythrobacter sp. SG61-1L]
MPRRSGPDRLAEEAAEWVARHDLGTAYPAAFEEWRGRSPAHALAFARAYAAWEKVSPGIGLDAEQAGTLAGASFSRRAMMRAAGAAGLIALGGGGLAVSRAYAWERIETGIGESRKLRLPDGSLLALNTDSSVAWRVKGGKRVLRLEKGEMALEVSPNGPPLLLMGDDVAISLTSGLFNARLKPGGIDVMVLRGQARSAEGAQAGAKGTHAPGAAGAYRMLSVTAAGPRISPASELQVAATLAWQNGEILFQDEPLSAAVDEYNRYLDGKIMLDDPALGAIRVGGRFTSTDPTVFFEALDTSLDIQAMPQDGGYLLRQKK